MLRVAEPVDVGETVIAAEGEGDGLAHVESTLTKDEPPCCTSCHSPSAKANRANLSSDWP